jgi:hypothetical protein
MRATAEKPTTPGTAAKARNLVTFRTSGAKGTPAAAEMLATLGSQSIAGTQVNSNDASNNSDAKSSRDAKNNTNANES